MSCPLSSKEVQNIIDLMQAPFDPITNFVPKCPRKDNCGKENYKPCGNRLRDFSHETNSGIMQIGRRNGGALWEKINEPTKNNQPNPDKNNREEDKLIIYPPIVPDFAEYEKNNYFKRHIQFKHPLSSQRANINLFFPILLHPRVNDILKEIKPDFVSLAKNHLYKGFKLEFWGSDSINEKGLLGDHSPIVGTDADTAITYYNNSNELCLWLIEHKLTEHEFSKCNACKSKNKTSNNDCSRSFADILLNKNLCYYHSGKKYKYWDITGENLDYFSAYSKYKECPFEEGMNQLWRNSLLALSVEKDEKQPYKHAFFSVVKHPENTYLDSAISKYKELIGNNNPKFNVFTSGDLINAATKLGDESLNKWVKWYKKIYNV